MSTAGARRTPKSHIVVPIVLGIFLIPLAQVALLYLGGYVDRLLLWSGDGGLVFVWVGGTPIAYFLTGGLGAFASVNGLDPAQTRRRGALAGLIAGISGACSAGLIVAAFLVWGYVLPQQRVAILHTHAGAIPRLSVVTMMGPAIPILLIVFIFLLFFLVANLVGFGLAPLGGMLGGYLRARYNGRGVTPTEQTGEPGITRSGRAIVVVAICAALLAIVIVTAGLYFFIVAISVAPR